MQLATNEGGFDRALRTTLGFLLVGSGALFPLTFYWLWAVLPAIGLVLLVTGIAGFCPIYKVLGLRTDGGGSTPKAPKQGPKADMAT